MPPIDGAISNVRHDLVNVQILATMITYVIIIVQWIITAQSNTDIEIANGVCPVWI